MLATVNDLLTRYDARLVADLAGDEGEPTPPAQSSRVTAALRGASGEVLAAARLGAKYSAEELAQLTDGDAEFLKDVVCALALLRLVGTRIQTIGEATHRALREQADRMLDDMRTGRLLFGTPRAQRAIQPSVEVTSVGDHVSLNLLPDRTPRYYPSRASRLPRPW